MSATLSIRQLNKVDDRQIDELVTVLIDCVEGGASVSFMHPLSRDRATAFWRRVANVWRSEIVHCSSRKTRTGFAGPCNSCSTCPRISRTAQTCRRCSSIDGDVARDWERPSLRAAEAAARDCGKTLARPRHCHVGDAARLYPRLGWVRVGDIPALRALPAGRPLRYDRVLSEPRRV